LCCLGKTCAFVLKSSADNLISDDSLPHSVAVGDFNNDGLPDIVVPNSGTNNIGVFLRQSNATFTDQMIYSTGSDSVPYAVAVADFNNDQRMDIGVANFGTHNIGIFLGTGNGAFRPQTTFSTGSARPRWIAVGDFNNDTQLDITVVNYGTNDIGVLLQDANGSFTKPTSFSTGYDSVPYSLVIADFNSDNKLDIVVANYGTNNLGVFLGHGDGTFAIQSIFTTGINSHPYSVAIANLNSDTHLDIVVACSGTNNIGVLLGYGNGTFTMPTKYFTGNDSSPLSIAIADFSDDNILDIAVANYGTASMGVLLGYGNGSFEDQTTVFTSYGFNPYAFATGDFNADNQSDVAVANYDYNYVDIIVKYKNYSFSSPTTYPTTGLGSNPESIAIADINNDSWLDIVVANYWTDNVGVFLGYGSGTFSSQTTYSTVSGSGPCSVAIGDFNNDGQLDIAVANYYTNNLGIFLGYGDGTFSSQTTFSTGARSHPGAVAVGDFNNDNRLDVAVANYGTNTVGVFLGYGTGRFSTQATYSTGKSSGVYSITTGDFNNDNRLDIAVANYGTNNVGVFLGYGNGTFSSQTTYSTGKGSGPVSITTGDFNNDNQLDVAVTNSGTNNVGIFLGYHNGTFSSQTTVSTGTDSEPNSITTGDFNNDNRLDIVVANYGTNNVGVFLGYDNGTFSSQSTYLTGSGSNPYWVAVGDLNNDGYPDIAVVNYGTSNIGIFIAYGNGSFRTEMTKSTSDPSNPQSVAVADFNDDRRLDIVVANYWSDTIDIFLGYGDGNFSSQVTYSTGDGSGPSSITTGDFNNDSRLDIVVANQWTYNVGVFLGYGDGTFSSQITYSTGYDSQPYAVVVGDFNNDNRLDVAVANYGTNNVGIFLGYGNGIFSSQATYSTGDGSGPYSITTGDFNNDSRLDIVVANFFTYNAGVFLGYGDGTFSNQTIYSTGKGSGPQDAVVGDLNNDDRLDIVVTLHDNSVIIVFLGYGNGSFFRGAIYSTGSNSNPYACVLGDVNNDNQLDVAVSDGYNGNVAVLLGYGDGSFSNERSYSTGSYSSLPSIAFGDFNNDSILDIVVANYYTNMIDVFLGFTYIDGVLEGTVSTGSSPHPRGIALGDFNNDAQLDIVMANYGLDDVRVLLAYTNTTYSMQMIFSTGVLSLPTSVAVGDFNNDSELDITVANSATENVGVLYGYGNGSYASPETYSTGSGSIPQSVTVGDFNNDKRLDIAVADSGTDSVLALVRYDTGAFGNQTVYLTGTDSQPMSVAVGDFNNDGQLDFVVANGDSDNVGVFLGFGNGTFSSQTIYSTGSGSYPWGIAVADFNKDSCLDIVVCNYWGSTIGIFLGFGNGTFSSQTTYSTGIYSGPQAIDVGDFNNDRQLDIVVGNSYDQNIGIFLGYGDGTFSSQTTFSTGSNSNPLSIAVADFNNDSRLDIVLADFWAASIDLFFGYGDGTFSDVITYSTGSSSSSASVAVGDFNNDGRLDVAVANSATDNIGVLFGNGNGTFSSQITFSTGSGSKPYALAIGDFNNDNQLDIAIANFGNNNLGVLLGCVNGTFFSQLTYSTGDGSQPFFMAVGEFNNDSRLDIVVANFATDSVGVFLGYVSESFLSAPAYSTGFSSQPTSVAVGDFNHDTRLDIVVANNGTDNVMVLFGSGYGTFVSQAMYSTGYSSHPCWVAVGDFNNDSRLDIVVANSGTNNVGVFLGNGTGTFSSQITYSTGLGSQPYSVAVLDFDNDTRLDIAVANYGTNNVGVLLGYGNGSFASQLIFNTGFDSHPFALVVGDINKDNLTDIVATNNGYGNIDILSKEC
jgi:hypothetical protein